MSAKYSKRDREDATMLCSIVACSSYPRWYPHDATHHLGLDDARPATLAWAAFHAARVPGRHNASEQFAEAEALIRTGWTP